MKFLSDLFKGPGGDAWELARVMTAYAIFAFTLPYIVVSIHRGTLPDPQSFGTGLAAVLGGCGLLIAGKDYVKSKFTGPDQAAGGGS